MMVISPEPGQMIDGRIVQCCPRGAPEELLGILVEEEISAG